MTTTAPPSAATTEHDATSRAHAETDRARWARPAFAGLLLVTAGLYLWDLGASGWGNSFYAAAAQAGSQSWTAFFFGASDAAASITVDKTPASVWVMALSVRVFGLSSWSILVPQALMGVASVALLTTSVRRATRSWGAGLLAGAVLATTPVAALMFRFDNPDALLVLLLVGATAAVLRAVNHPRALRWLLLAGSLVGLAFLTKMLQAFLVLPVFALVYLLESRLGWGRKVIHLLAALAAVVVAGGWWVAAVELWPGARPWIGGSQEDSVLELTLGYNGLGRLTGEETGSVGGGMGWGETGWLRLLGGEMGGQVAWLLPAALLLLGSGVWLTRRRARGDDERAAILVWGGWLLVTGVVFSFMAGIFHSYYTVALAPAIAAVVGIGAHQLWVRRDYRAAAVFLGLVVAVGAVTAYVLLGRSPDFVPWLRWVVLVAGLLAGAALALGPLVTRLARRAAVATAVVVLLAGPTAYTLDTVTTPHTGSLPSAGPTTTGQGMPDGGFGGGFGGGPPTGAPGATNGAPTGAPPGGAAGAAGGGGGMGGLLDSTEPTAEVVAMLETDAGSFTWVAATVGSQNASGYQLATEESVMPIGGFNGTDPSPTLAEFQALVADGEIHWFIGGGGAGGGGGFGGPGGGSDDDTTSTSSQITGWVEETFTSTTVDGVTLYDLTSPVSAS